MALDVKGVASAVGRAARGQDAGTGAWVLTRRLHYATGGVSTAAGAAVERLLPGARRPAPTGPVDSGVLAALRRDGLAVLPWRLDDETVRALRDRARRIPLAPLGCDLPTHQAITAEGPHDYASLRERAPMGVLDRPALVDDPHLQHLIADPRLTDLAAAYLRCTPTLRIPSGVWTFGGRPLPEHSTHATRNATQYHIDIEGLSSLRVHVYLTDVGPDDAPMRFARGSQRISLKRIPLLRKGFVGLEDDEVHAACGAGSETVITGPAGTVFLSTGFGLHRGTPITPGHERLFLIITFTGPVVSYPEPPMTVAARDPQFAARLAAGDPVLRRFRPVA